MQPRSCTTGISYYSESYITLLFLSINVIPVNIIFASSVPFADRQQNKLLTLSELERIVKETGCYLPVTLQACFFQGIKTFLEQNAIANTFITT